jgi:hypothetical protein
VAKAASSAFAPYDDPEWEVWGMPWVVYRRTLDVYFDVHTKEFWDKSALETDWVDRINQTGAPIYCDASQLDTFKNGVEFPFEAIEKTIPTHFFENSIAFQIAFAILSHETNPIDEIGVYGVNMMGSREYLWERASVVYMIGLAQGRGIKVTIPPGCPLFVSYWTAGKYGQRAEKRFDLNT